MTSRGMNVNSHIDKGNRKNRMSIVKKEQDLTREFEDKLIDWCTFYRRNIHRFIEHYLGINLLSLSKDNVIYDEFIPTSCSTL